MAQDYKIINIYIDKNKALYGAPFGPSEKYGKRPLDKLFLLMPGYSDEMLCDFVNRLFDQCDTEDARDDMPPSIQTYLKARSYREATANLGLLVGFYAEGEGNIASYEGRKMLSELESCCNSVKIIASYEKEQKV